MYSISLDLGGMSRRLTAATARWLHDLADLVPSSLTRPKGPRIIVAQTGRGLKVFTLSDGRFVQLGPPGAKEPQTLEQITASLRAIDLNGADVVLRLSSEHVLQREIRMPKAARDVLEPVIANQMDELTPWSQADTVFGYRIADDGEADSFTVHVAATSKKIVDEALATARVLGLQPRVVECAKPGEPDSVPPEESGGIVIRGGTDQSRVKTARQIGSALASFLFLVAAAGVGGLATMLWEQSTLNDLQAQANRQRSTLASITQRDASTLELQQQSREVTALKSTRPSILVTLEALTRALPDTVWLTSLEVRGDEAQLKGRADSAPELIAELEKLPHFERVRFSAPTTRTDGEQQETFAISAKILPVMSLE